MPEYTDQTGRKLILSHKPRRIVSVVPSQSELLADLGLEAEVIGITKFCIHPGTWFRNKTRIGGTKNLHIQKIRSLQPDLIIANKEENLKEEIELLAKEFPVWVSDIQNLEQSLSMIKSIGNITGKEKEAENIISYIQNEFSKLDGLNSELGPCSYLIWKDPYMTIGGDSFINDMLQRAGFKNVFQHLQRYPEIALSDLKECPMILLSSEPFPFKEKHVEELKALLTQSQILLVDGEMFSWYGSRLIKAPSYFLQLKNQIHAFP